MARFIDIKKKEWTKDELLSALKVMGDNPFTRAAIEQSFDIIAIKNASGELVIANYLEIDARSLILNLQARHLERFILNFMSKKGVDIEKFIDESLEEFHGLLTSLVEGMQQGRR